MSTVTPHLWFNDNAEEAISFYVGLFPNSTVDYVQRIPDGSDGPGAVLTAGFTLDGQPFRALNGGPQFPFTEAYSMFVDCADQAEVDRLWDALVADGGEPGQCGWCKDRFGLSWQIIPSQLGQLLGGPDPVRAQAATEAMLQMSKIEVAQLQAAYDGA